MVKRPAAVSDSDSDGDQASKRARTEGPGDDEAPRGTRRRRPQARANGRSTQRDNGDEIEELSEGESEIGVSAPINDDDDDDEKFEKRHGDTVRKQLNNKKSTKKGIADYGVIEAIEMHQFMCHKKLSFEFGPQINFIIGHNGSGKSAVLSALTIALGGKTNSTGRGSGLKSFIREGQNGSEVTVKLKNQGSEGYKHVQYGDSIIITRRFTKEGSSTWKIQDKSGKLVSNKREELSAICDHMNIQVDNPMNVLTQDSARQFLSASAPTDKYKFFLLGTQLFQLSNEYDTCLQNISKTYKILGLKHSAIPDLRDKYREALAKFEEAKKAREQKKKSDELKKELAWSHVATKRMEMERKVDEVVKLKRRVPKIEEGLAEAEAAVSEYEANIEALENEVAELGDQTQLTAERTKITNEIKANSKKLSALNADMNTINRTLKSVNTQIEGLDKQIATEEARMAKHSQDRREQLDHRINGAKSVIEAAEQRYKDVLREKQSLKEQLAIVAQEGDKLDKDLNGVKQEIAQCQSNIDEARRSVNDAYAPYGNNIQAVCAKMRTMQWHGEVPLGPLGMHVKAKDPATWGDLLRAQLGNLLCSFALTDARDRPQMKRLLDQNHNRNTIIIYERDLFNFSRGEPDPRYLTVLRALDISDEYVTRILVNQSRIENVILARTRREVQDQLEELRGGVGWSHDRFTVRVFPEGGCTSTPLPKGGVHNFLLTGRDSASEIGHHEQEKRRLEQSHEAITGEIAKRKQAFFEMKKANEKLSAPEAQAVREIRAAKHELTTLQQEADEDLPTTIAGFKSARDEAVKEKELHMAQFEEVCKSKADIDSANHPLQRASDLLKAQLDDFTARKTALTEQIVNASVNRVQKQADVKNLKDRLDKQKGAIAVEEDLASTLEQEFKNWTESALGFCPEVPNPRSLAQVQRELDSVNHALKERERRHGATVEDMAAEVTKTRAAFDKAHSEYKQMAELNRALKTSLSLRLHRWQEFRRHIALRTKFIFQLHMSQRGYFGKLMFNHTAQTLNIRVQTDDQAAAEGNAEKDPRSLSGGEKSFSTICLLLSLWDSIGCPLRCLDEFDVFMDAVNRRISMKMMIATANDSPDKQYILITPQDMTNIRIEDNVKVHRMNDPERNTGRLRFGAGPSNE